MLFFLFPSLFLLENLVCFWYSERKAELNFFCIQDMEKHRLSKPWLEPLFCQLKVIRFFDCEETWLCFCICFHFLATLRPISIQFSNSCDLEKPVVVLKKDSLLPGEFGSDLTVTNLDDLPIFIQKRNQKVCATETLNHFSKRE